MTTADEMNEPGESEDRGSRRRPPQVGCDDVLTAEVMEQLRLAGLSRSEFARRIGWNVHSAGRLINSNEPRQAWTVAELRDVARGFGCTLSSLLRGAGIDPPGVDELDAVLSSKRLSRETKVAVAQLIRLDLQRGEGR